MTTMVDIERRVQGVLLAMFAALLVAIVMAFAFTRYMTTTSDWVSHTYAVMTTIETAKTDIAQALSATRAYAITGDATFLAVKNRKGADLQQQLALLRHMTSDNATEQAHVRALTALAGTWRLRLGDVERARAIQGFAAAAALVQKRHAAVTSAAMFGVLDDMHAVEQRLLLQRRSEVERLRHIVSALFVALGCFALILSLVIYAQIRRHIRHWDETQHQLERLNRDLDQKTQSLQETVRDLESFSYSVSHDLRAPLRHITGYASMLLEDAPEGLDSESLRHLNVIADSARHMGALIDDLLAFSRLGRKPMDKQPIDMQNLVEDIIREIGGARNDGAAAPVHIQASALPPCIGDPALIRQVWINLLSNAIKYSAPRGAAAEIEITGESDAEWARYRVRDNGVGFDMRYADKLFGVFQRLHAPEQFEGTGVGLAIVHRVVTRHGGRVDAVGKTDHGATFSFELPITEATS
ncbi:MAG: CHASE3 domain-containing protein [Xanthomonadaceae bacterium]|nr:CHASE3 domain-containing protein [Xanthomonadaceae bacterium]MDE1959876.1 CHASE3 domain-containing protein [Xanthomonadaceae bacterium]